MSKNPISKEGYDKLMQELDSLYREERPRVVSDVAFAAAQGDRSENADYIYGKKKLREIDRRIRELDHILQNSLVIDGPPVECNTIRFGAKISVRRESGIEMQVCIVGKAEINPSEGRLSKESPMGKALLGLKVGDIAKVPTPKGEVRYEVLSINY